MAENSIIVCSKGTAGCLEAHGAWDRDDPHACRPVQDDLIREVGLRQKRFSRPWWLAFWWPDVQCTYRWKHWP